MYIGLFAVNVALRRDTKLRLCLHGARCYQLGLLKHSKTTPCR